MSQILLGIFSLLILAATIVIIISLILKIKDEKSHEFTSYYHTVSWMRILSAFIDWAILAILFFLIPKMISLVIPINDNYLDLTRILVTYSATTFLIVKYGGTPGKLLLNIKITNVNGMNLSIKKAILRQIFSISSELISLYIVLIVAYATRSALPFNILFLKVFILIIPVIILSALSLLDSIFIITSKNNRAIHDYLADSIVIYRDEFNPLKRSNESGNTVNSSVRAKELYSPNNTFKAVISTGDDRLFQIDFFMWDLNSWISYPGEPLVTDSGEAAEKIAKEKLEKCTVGQFKKDSNLPDGVDGDGSF